MNYWQKLKYKNLSLLFLSVIAAFVLYKWEPFHTALVQVNQLGFLGAFFGGILFVFTFTVAVGGIILFNLTDLIIFKFVRNKLVDELRPIYDQLGGGHLTNILHTVYLRWTLPIIGALILASPLPDELGVTLMGISGLSTRRFIVISFLLDTVGILLLLAGLSVFI